ncbi:ParB/Srx family N-terminal domain-containing protein [Sphingomonas sp. NFR04]|jgi:ParB-like chromosome segregation protein Spo0J|uniref:ParB/Srx family N-terminal domain-containing protein n=1 Tax=Sphingomonas sp. NFR04 TaxID=1566283 RepID=UPI00111454AB|nr:ParB/Srx family N-terminal domain-containing protein [Sphingomonas sp. NFR04]
MWTIDKVKPYAKNTKVHSPQHIAKLKASISADGLFDALIVDLEGVLIAGHGRYEALVALGHTTVPVKHAAHLSKNQADAARIAHNKTASTEYDSGFMAEELKRLMDADDVDIAALGFEEHELDFLIEDLGTVDIAAISTDLDADIDRQDAETEEKVAKTDASEEKLTKALGFNAIPIAAVRDVRRFIAQIEADTGKTGAEAFVEFCRGR